MFTYRNSRTGDLYSTPVRSVRLDHLANWSLVDGDTEVVIEAPAAPVTEPVTEPVVETPVVEAPAVTVPLDETEAEAPSARWSNPQISEWASDHGIDLGGATRKADMLAAIKAAMADRG